MSAFFKKAFGIALFVGLMLTNATFANHLIEGFAKWQANRIEQVAIDQALEDIAEETYVQKFFTDTARAIQFYDTLSGQRLIPLMQAYLKSDIARFETVTRCFKEKLKVAINHQDFDKIDALLQNVKALTNTKNPMTTTKFLAASGCSDSEKTLKTGRTISYSLRNIDIESMKGMVRANTDAEINKLKNDLEVVRRLLKLLEQIEESIKKIEDDDLSYVMKAHQMLQIIDLIGRTAEELLDFKGYNLAAINRLKSISLFLAELADASDDKTGSPDQVVAILNQYVNEQDTYNRKRHNTAYLGFVRKNDYKDDTIESKNYFTTCVGTFIFPCRDSFFLTSYYGLSIMEIDQVGDGNKEVTGRAYGPVGFELKLMNYRGSPITLGYAPIDIGNYVTAELKGDSYDAKTEDIIAPSVFFAWSAASRPFSILVGYQKDIKIENGLKEDAFFISFSFDLPIATIF